MTTSTETQSTNQQQRRLSDADIDAAADQMAEAFSLCGLTAGNALICPECGTSKPKKVVYKKAKKYWKCYRCGAWGSATRLLQEQLGLSFPKAVKVLLGKDTVDSNQRTQLVDVKHIVADEFQADIDYELYEQVLNSRWASSQAAQQFYRTWHISPETVVKQRAVVITDPDMLLTDLVEEHGETRLTQAGIAKAAEEREFDGKPVELPLRLLVNAKYPVVEPAVSPNGLILNMQFRASAETKRRVDRHKQDKHDDSVADGDKTRYVPPFLSLRGQTAGHMIGCGLEQLAAAEPGSVVYVVEGFKDMLAANTMAGHAYAVPGASVLPPQKVCEYFKSRDFEMLIALDGDEQGKASSKILAEHFEKNGVRCRLKADIGDGMDIADILVSRCSRNGCPCRTCRSWDDNHPFE